jgi:hypothetical protein
MPLIASLSPGNVAQYDCHKEFCVARQDKGRDTHRKSLGWPLLDLEASQVPVQLSASNRHGSSRRVESASAPTSPATSSSSSGGGWHVGLSGLKQSSKRPLELQVRIVGRDGRRSCRVRNSLVVARAAACCGGAPLASEPHFHHPTRSCPDPKHYLARASI